jgi:hypothetical protein
MFPVIYYLYCLLSACTLLVFAWTFHRYGRHNHLYPPGPPGVPVLGNLLDIPSRFEWITYEKWARTYGESYLLGLISVRPRY